jgi:small neutral amino acid transporter SnatA (MarC family)
MKNFVLFRKNFLIGFILSVFLIIGNEVIKNIFKIHNENYNLISLTIVFIFYFWMVRPKAEDKDK